MSPSSSPRLPRPGPRGTLGILGGGQLGRMLLPIAHRWALQTAVLDPSPDAPSAPLAHRFVVGDLQDYDTVLQFGRSVDLLTFEIESINVDALETLAAEGRLIRPAPGILRIIQDKRRQKAFLRDHGLPTLPFTLIGDTATLRAHPPTLPAVFKLGQGGYDGRGVWVLRTPADLDLLPLGAAGLLEPLLDHMREVSVIVVRSVAGQMVTYPIIEMAFHPTANLVELLLSPARLDPVTADRCQEIALATAEALGVVGLLAVEMFIAPDGEVLINECSPRPHNSGHHTIEANPCSQYEQLLRAVLDFPLGAVAPARPAVMANLLGAPGHTGPAHYPGVAAAMALPGVSIHLYGKTHTRPLRKMGHITAVADDLEAARRLALQARDLIRVTAHSTDDDDEGATP